jgi:hypothetical protein
MCFGNNVNLVPRSSTCDSILTNKNTSSIIICRQLAGLCNHGVTRLENVSKWCRRFEICLTHFHDDVISGRAAHVKAARVEASLPVIYMLHCIWLFVNGCKCKEAINTAAECLHSFHAETNASMCYGVTLRNNNNNKVEHMACSYGFEDFSFTSYDPADCTY